MNLTIALWSFVSVGILVFVAVMRLLWLARRQTGQMAARALTPEQTRINARMAMQATSGRWLLTVTAGVAFFMFCFAVCIVVVSVRLKLEPATVVGLFGSLLLVIQGVYKDYFNRTDRDGNHQDGNGKPEGPQGP